MRTNAIAITKRRKALLTEASKGNLAQGIKDLANRYNVTENAIYMDWENRETWVKDIIDIQDPTLGNTWIQGMALIINEAWLQYNLKKTIGWLRLAKDTYTTLVDILIKSGNITKQQALDQIKEINVNWDLSKLDKLHEIETKDQSLKNKQNLYNNTNNNNTGPSKGVTEK